MNNPTQPATQTPAPRSESLLPADEANPAPEVAEEVAFDLQSDQARRVGAMPPHAPGAPGADAAEAMAEALQPRPQDQDAAQRPSGEPAPP